MEKWYQRRQHKFTSFKTNPKTNLFDVPEIGKIYKFTATLYSGDEITMIIKIKNIVAASLNTHYTHYTIYFKMLYSSNTPINYYWISYSGKRDHGALELSHEIVKSRNIKFEEIT